MREKAVTIGWKDDDGEFFFVTGSLAEHRTLNVRYARCPRLGQRNGQWNWLAHSLGAHIFKLYIAIERPFPRERWNAVKETVH